MKGIGLKIMFRCVADAAPYCRGGYYPPVRSKQTIVGRGICNSAEPFVCYADIFPIRGITLTLAIFIKKYNKKVAF